MKQLKRISGRNFLAHPTLDIKIEKQVLLLAGQNNVGKSSIKDIVEFVFTGKCPNRGVLKAKDHRKLRNNKASAKAQCGGTIEWIESGMHHDKTRMLSDGLTNPDGNRLIPYCLNPLRFIKLSSDERAALLASVYEPSRTVIKDAVRKHIAPDADDEQPIFTKPIMKRVKQSGIDPYNLDALLDCVVDFRQQLKREKKAAAGVAFPELVDFGLPADYTEQVKLDGEALAGITGQQLDTLKAVQVRAGKLEGLMDQAERHETQLKELEERLAKPLPDAPDATHNTLLLALSESIVAFGESDPDITYCPFCQTQEVKMQSIVEVANSTIKNLSELNEQNQKYRQEWEQIVEAFKQATSRHNFILEQLNRLKDERDVLFDQVAKDEAVTDEAVAEKQRVVDNITAALENYTKYRTALALHQEQEKTVEEKTKLIDECNSIAAALADGGSVKSEIQESSESLPINPALLEAWGLHGFEIKSDGEIIVNDTEVELLSDSEQYRIAAAVGIALAEVGDVGFCCLDGFEILMPDKQNAFMENLFAKFDIPLLIISVSRPEQYKDVPDWIQYEWIE